MSYVMGLEEVLEGVLEGKIVDESIRCGVSILGKWGAETHFCP